MGVLHTGPRHLIKKTKSAEDEALLQSKQDEIDTLKQQIDQLNYKLANQEPQIITKTIPIQQVKTVEIVKEVEVVKEIPRIVHATKFTPIHVEKIIEKPVEVIKQVIKEIPVEIKVLPKWVYGVISVQTLLIVLLLLK
jgi:NH3-dependent NAD+ synthetase